jgi:hypothetical protein
MQAAKVVLVVEVQKKSHIDLRRKCSERPHSTKELISVSSIAALTVRDGYKID